MLGWRLCWAGGYVGLENLSCDIRRYLLLCLLYSLPLVKSVYFLP